MTGFSTKSRLPLWGKANIPQDREHARSEDRMNFWAVMRVIWRVWPYIWPQILDRDQWLAIHGRLQAWLTDKTKSIHRSPDLPKVRYFASMVYCYMVYWFQCGMAILFRPRMLGPLFWYYVIYWLQYFQRLVTTAWTLDILYTTLLQGQPLTKTLAWLMGLDIPTYAGIHYLTTDQREKVLWLYLIVMLVVAFLRNAFMLILQYFGVWIMQRVNQDLRLALVERWHSLSMRYHNDARVGDNIYRIYQDSAMVTSIVQRVVRVCSYLSTLIITTTLVVCFDPWLALLVLLSFAPTLGWGFWFSPRLRTFSRVARETNAALTARIQEIFTGIRIVKGCGAEKREQARFEEDSVVAFNASFRTRSMVALVSIVVFSIMSMLVLSTDYFMAIWANINRDVFFPQLMVMLGVSYTVWHLASFQWGRNKLSETTLDVRYLAREWAVAQDMTVGLSRVFDILDIDPEVKDRLDAVPMPAFQDEIRFENVTFGYDPEIPVIKHVNFTVKSGTINAIVGPTGSGKSTLMVLLLRLFDLDNGHIRIDGRDITEFKVESLRENIAIALQENMLFNQSVSDNIRYSHPAAADDQVRAAAKVAAADEYIRKLPRGYDTMLGERAGKLSTGERQRLSIARAVIKDAAILILDEPTASLDAETELTLIQNLAEWGKNRVIFLITHRLSTIRSADQILYLDDGQLLEAGSHDELMQVENGHYRGFVETEESMTSSRRIV